MQSSAAELAALSQPLVGWLVDSPPSPHAPPRLASPSRRERGECSAAEGHQRRGLRVRRRPAPPEPTGPRHRGRLAGDRPKKRNCAFTTGATHLAIWTSSMCSPLLYRSRRGATVPSALSNTCRGQRLAGGDDKHSQPNAELAKGRQVRMPHARPSTRRRRGWTSSATEWRCSTRTAAMAPRCQPYVPPLTPATVGGAWAALHDLTPHLLSIASSGSPECRMRCAIAHF